MGGGGVGKGSPLIGKRISSYLRMKADDVIRKSTTTLRSCTSHEEQSPDDDDDDVWNLLLELLKRLTKVGL